MTQIVADAAVGDVESLQKQRQDWIELLQIAIEEYCSQEGYYPRNMLRKKLDISRSSWEIMTGGKGFTDINTYAVLFYETGIEQADPRTLPPRMYHLPKGGYSTKSQAMSEEAWIVWVKQYESSKTEVVENFPDSSPAPLPNSELISPCVEVTSVTATQQPAQAVRPRVTSSSTFQERTRREFDSFFERFMSRVVPREVEFSDSHMVDELLWAMKGVFEGLDQAQIEERARFSARHGRILVVLLSYFEVYSHPDEKKREHMLSMIGFGKERQSHD